MFDGTHSDSTPSEVTVTSIFCMMALLSCFPGAIFEFTFLMLTVLLVLLQFGVVNAYDGCHLLCFYCLELASSVRLAAAILNPVQQHQTL